MAQDAISKFSDLYHCSWLTGMKAKLGLIDSDPEDENLINELLSIMEKYQADYTNTFRALTLNELDRTELYSQPEFARWYKLWQDRLEIQKGRL